MSALSSRETNEIGITTMLRRSLAELDQELITEQPTIQDGCGASVALLVGDRLFTAALGHCGILLFEPSHQRSQSSKTPQSEATSLKARSIDDSLARKEMGINPRSLGDRGWKSVDGNMMRFATCTSCKLSYDSGHTLLMLISGPVSTSLSRDTASEVLDRFGQRARAISGEVVAKASEVHKSGGAEETFPQQFTAVTVAFLPPREIPQELQHLAPKSAKAAPAPPPGKKQKTESGKTETNSLRLRHILVRHAECNAPFDPARQKPVTRHLSEADAVLRRVLHDLLKEQAARKPPADPKKAALELMPGAVTW
jgi:hypothetical protein